MKPRAAFVLLLLASARSAVADPQASAEQLYRDGQAAYDQAHYDDALAAWQQSYELAHLPALHYNLGQAYRLRARPGDCARARQHYQSFVQVAEPSPQRSLAEGYIAQLAECVTAPAIVSTSPAVVAVSVSDDRSTRERAMRNRRIAGAAIGAGGVALFATGLLFGHHASTLGNEATADCAMSCDWSKVKSVDSSGHTYASLGWTFDTLGVLAVAGGAALYYFGIPDSEVHVAPLATRSHESGAVVSWSKTW